MITLASGNIFDADVDIRVNTVNCVGAMGAGVALAFKTRYPEMFREYKKACKDGRIHPGKIHVWKQLDGTWIINFPTKRHWREPSRYEDIEAGLADLRSYLQEQGHVSIAMPALGCGHGGLDWDRVKDLITDALGDLDAEILLYEPSSSRAAGEQVKGGIDPHVVEQLEREGVSILKPGDALYPEAIRGVRATTVFVKGNPELLARPLLAVFPSRKPDEKEIAAAMACIEAIAKPGMTILLGYGPHIDRDLIRLALGKGALVAVRFEEGISNFRIRKDIEDVWEDERIAVIATEATGRWNLHTGRKMTGLALDLAKVALVTDPNPQWMQRFADDPTRSSQVFFIDYHTSSPAAKQALMSVGAKPVRRDARSGNPSVDEIVNALGVGESPVPTSPVKQPVKQAEIREKTSSTKHDEIMPRYPKRLIEVDLPIKRISAHARRDQNIRKGHLHTMHVWWATRPLASCRAVLMATLLPDPADENCPQQFRDRAAASLGRFARTVTQTRRLDPVYRAIIKTTGDARAAQRWSRYTRLSETAPTDAAGLALLRDGLLDFIADFADWDAGVDPVFLQTARGLVAAAHPDGPPLVLDPFAGAGSILFEALRVGAQAFAGDLNPVAVLLNKVALEYLPKYGRRLAEGVEKWGKWVLERAREKLAPYYPADPKGNIPLATIWARTITCEGPGCGAEVPLLGMLWLSRKKKSMAALRYRGDRQTKRVVIEVFQPKSERDVQGPIVHRFSATCPVCGYTTPYKSVREQLRAKRGGTQDARLIAVITLDKHGGRHFRLPTEADREAAEAAARDLTEIERKHTGRWSFVPDEPTPECRGPGASRAFSLQRYGILQWSDVYLPRGND